MTQDFYKKMLIEENISVITPSDEDIKIVNDIIFNELCKGEIKQDSKEKYLNIIKKLQEKGAKGVLLACTEIGLLISKMIQISKFLTQALFTPLMLLMKL